MISGNNSLVSFSFILSHASESVPQLLRKTGAVRVEFKLVKHLMHLKVQYIYALYIIFMQCYNIFTVSPYKLYITYML